MQKKLIVLILAILLLPLGTVTVSAAEYDMVYKKSFTAQSGNTTTFMTGDVDSTAVIDKTRWLKHTFDSPVTISSVLLKVTSGPNLNMQFYDVLGQITDSITITSNVKMTVNVHDVKAIRIIGTQTKYSELKNIKVYGPVIDLIAPDKPQIIDAIGGYDQIKINWKANVEPDLLGYNIYVNGVKQNNTPMQQTSYIFNSIDYTSVFSFYVTALDNSLNESSPSDVVKATPIERPDTTPPAKPMGMSAIGEVAQVRLSWNQNKEPDLAGYLIYKNNFLLFQNPIMDNDFVVIGGLNYDTDNEFYVVAVDTSGNRSLKSETVKAKPIKPIDTTPPNVPTGLKASMTSDFLKIKATWTGVQDTDLDGYYIYVSTDGGNTWVRNNPPPIKAAEYDIYPITPDTEYQIKVTAIDYSGNESVFSNTVTLKTPNKNTVVTPSKPQPDYMDITWSQVPGAVKYQIIYNAMKVGEVPAGTTTFRITKAMGYNFASAIKVVDVIPVFANGSTGGSNQPGKPVGSGWGFDAADIFKNSMWLIASLASLVLFGIVMKFVPKLIDTIKTAIRRRRME